MLQEDNLKNIIIAGAKYNENNTYRFILFFSMLSMTIMLCKGIFSYRLVELSGHVMQAGQLVAPIWFLLSDVIAEVYGYQNSKKIIYSGFVCQIIFAIICYKLLQLPFPSFWKNSEAYQIVLGDMWRVSLAVLVAFTVAGFINIKLICKWKMITKGKYFWLRSIGASGISEVFFSVFSTFIIQINKQPVKLIVLIIFASITIKLISSICLSIPANLLVYYLKKIEGI